MGTVALTFIYYQMTGSKSSFTLIFVHMPLAFRVVHCTVIQPTSDPPVKLMLSSLATYVEVDD